MTKELLEKFYEDFDFEWQFSNDYIKNEVVDYLNESINYLVDKEEEYEDLLQKMMEEIKKDFPKKVYDYMVDAVEQKLAKNKSLIRRIEIDQQDIKDLTDLEKIRISKGKLFRIIYLYMNETDTRKRFFNELVREYKNSVEGYSRNQKAKNIIEYCLIADYLMKSKLYKVLRDLVQRNFEKIEERVYEA